MGSLPIPITKFPAPIRPLTWKMHEMLQLGGVDAFGMLHVPPRKITY